MNTENKTKHTFINWVPVGTRNPTNVGKPFDYETPFVSCIVWVCNPEFPHGGVFECARWDTKNEIWIDLRGWSLVPHMRITHFCDDITRIEDPTPIKLTAHGHK